MRNDNKPWKRQGYKSGGRTGKQFGGPLAQPLAQPLARPGIAPARPGVAPARPLGFKKGRTAKAGGGYVYNKKK